ncbi:unnamed protein product [Polarella glacialis]|uniref:Uncharacterized protein n=1 Tax=Polarella glacialis TaxID=89957 RepID=A0A813H9X2_POLGL|nr:unnamed protein product [Polarella glacialis]
MCMRNISRLREISGGYIFGEEGKLTCILILACTSVTHTGCCLICTWVCCSTWSTDFIWRKDDESLSQAGQNGRTAQGRFTGRLTVPENNNNNDDNDNYHDNNHNNKQDNNNHNNNSSNNNNNSNDHNNNNNSNNNSSSSIEYRLGPAGWGLASTPSWASLGTAGTDWHTSMLHN